MVVAPLEDAKGIHSRSAWRFSSTSRLLQRSHQSPNTSCGKTGCPMGPSGPAPRDTNCLSSWLSKCPSPWPWVWPWGWSPSRSVCPVSWLSSSGRVSPCWVPFGSAEFGSGFGGGGGDWGYGDPPRGAAYTGVLDLPRPSMDLGPKFFLEDDCCWGILLPVFETCARDKEVLSSDPCEEDKVLCLWNSFLILSRVFISNWFRKIYLPDGK